MFSIEFHTKKTVGTYVYFPPEWSIMGSKEWYVSNIILYWNGKVDSVWDSTLPKIRIIREKTLKKKLLSIEFRTKPHSSILEWDRGVHPLTFLYAIQSSTTFIWSVFGYNTNFWMRQVEPQSDSTFLFLNIIIFQNMTIFGDP